ncbi:MFS transporter [Planotetraspora kaengkrachanensis]|uniref:MFS transporter n=1 Tax=Planotetraspora kaengkrachanensis TaxID=575193 RepID=A0A8J3Q0J8_9ACTN|nr:MFS transporter [Planotetraspora kaengkrachanensis]GIG84527.1 MFS transporter [Planotetraspora kaengkrachanensis]
MSHPTAGTPETAVLTPARGAPAAAKNGRMVSALVFVVLVYALMQTMLVPALPVLGSDLHAGLGASGWVLTSYLLTGSVLAPIAGSFGDRLGHRRVLVVVLVVFAIATFAAAFASTIGVLIACRAVQGISTAAFPLALAIVRRHSTGKAMNTAIGWISGVLGLGAGAALVIGGAILKVTSWQGMFVFTGVLIVISLVFVVAWVPHTHRTGQASRTDWVGAVLLTVALVSLLLGVTQAPSWGWTAGPTLLLFCGAVAAFAVLVIVEHRVATPLVDVRSLTRPSLAIANVLVLVNGFVSYIIYVCLPSILEADPGTGYGYGYDVLRTGLVLLPSAVCVFVGGRAAPALLGRVGHRPSMVIAMASMGLGALGLTFWPAAMWSIIASFCVLSLGIGGGVSVIYQIIARVVPVDEVAAAGGLNTVIRSVGSAAGSPAAGAILAAGVGGATTTVALANYQHAFALAAVLSVAAAGLALLLRMPANR